MNNALQILQVFRKRLQQVPGIRLLIMFTAISFFSGCDMQSQKQALKQKEDSLLQKEQELLVRETSVQLKEDELNERQRALDSASNISDTLSALHPTVPGIWNVTMRCIETNCTGSAVGDVKNEQWDISFQNNNINLKAMSDNKLLRIYSGTYLDKTFQLTAQQESTASDPVAKMVVRLQPSKDNEMTGQREIIRSGCRIVYALELKKQL